MQPRAAANLLTKALRSALPQEKWLPVDPLTVAKELGVQVHVEDLGTGFEGALLCAGKNAAIVLNARILDPGRRSFTAAHELGHYSLHRDRQELKCSIGDLLDVAPHPANIEQEANEFAMTLLMPIDDVRAQASGQLPSLSLVKRMAGRYGTSLTATALRLRESSARSFAIAFVKRGILDWWWPTSHFRWRPKKQSPWPSAIGPQDEPLPYKTAEIFGLEAQSRLGAIVRISGIEMPSYEASLWIVETPDERKPWEWTAIPE